MRAYDLLEVPARTEHRQDSSITVLGQRLLVEVADRLQAELRHLQEPLRRQPADSSGTDDQGRPQPFAGDAVLPLRPVESRAPRGEEGGRVQPEPQRLIDRVGAGAGDCGDRQQQDRSEARRPDDPSEVVERANAEPRPVEAASAQQREDEQAVAQRPGAGDGDAGNRRADRRRRSGEREHRDVGQETAQAPREVATQAVLEEPPLWARREVVEGIHGRRRVDKLSHRRS